MSIVERLCIEGYRSLRDLRLEIAPLTVVTGANGSGKSSLYRALRLIADVAQGRVVGALAAEGGLGSVLWAGPETLSRGMKRGEVPVQGGPRRASVALRLGFSSQSYGYAIDLGLPVGGSTRFVRDPVIKAESLWTGPLLGRANTFAQRKGSVVSLRNAEGAWRMASDGLGAGDSMLTHCSDPRDAAELLMLRETLRDWRFYDHLRTDGDAPARRRQVGTRTPVLASDGADLAAAIATIQDVGESEALDETVSDAFPGGSVDVEEQGGSFEIAMRQHGLLRPLRAAELSDGTLRYLLLVAALLSPRPPTLMILNEPETSLHPDLLPALSRLIARAAKVSQLIVVSHAPALVAALQEAGAHRIVLEKNLGETIVADAERPAWNWPTR